MRAINFYSIDSVELSFAGNLFREHGLIVAIFARWSHREIHVQVTAVAIFFYVVIVQGNPGYSMVKRTHHPVNMATDASGLGVLEGIGIPVTSRAVQFCVVGLQRPACGKAVLEPRLRLIAMTEATIPFSMTRAASGHMIYPGGLFLVSIMAATARITPVTVGTLLPEHLHVIVVVESNNGTFFTVRFVGVGGNGLNFGVRNADNVRCVGHRCNPGAIDLLMAKTTGIFVGPIQVTVHALPVIGSFEGWLPQYGRGRVGLMTLPARGDCA